MDETSGSVYYYHGGNGKTQWERPSFESSSSIIPEVMKQETGAKQGVSTDIQSVRDASTIKHAESSETIAESSNDVHEKASVDSKNLNLKNDPKISYGKIRNQNK